MAIKYNIIDNSNLYLFTLVFIGITLLSGCTQSKQNNLKVKDNSVEKAEAKSSKTFGIVIHGGAGTIKRANLTQEKETEYKEQLEEAIKVGHTILKNGGSSLEAVEQTIIILENSLLFNAGKGAVFTHDETNELDASVMDGSTLKAGAVAGVQTIKNPIRLAMEVMNNSPHVLLSGKGAEQFAAERNIEKVNPKYFYTERRFEALQKAKKKALEKKDKATTSYESIIKDTKFGTVGCVALDLQGNLAAGTSTGGMTNKQWNRIGDSPIIGAGTYANNATCAVSSTGHGEYFMRALVAHDISAMMDYKDISLLEAAKEVIQKKLTQLGGSGGIIAIDHTGNIAMEFNTSGMYRAAMNAKGELTLGIYEK